ncbi:hypothetical protein GCM10009720_19480 [Yaniella flava]|uniref:Protein tyrosine phosphatase n=2 Tax=Yaniella flava TaxID=287930 RepID=A0ABP5G2G1_9MICC
MGRAEWVDSTGWRQMVNDGVSTVIDVRTPPEIKRRELDPEAEVPDEVRQIHVPVEDVDHEPFWERNAPYPMHPDAYHDTLATFGDRVAAAVSTLVDSWEAGGTVLHCTAGRDRTSLIMGLALQLPNIPGGAADWEEHKRVYASGAYGINEHHRTSPIPHPYESYLEPEAFDRELADRLASYRTFLKEWPGERVQELLECRAQTEKA